jgi:hypothetical protein
MADTSTNLFGRLAVVAAVLTSIACSPAMCFAQLRAFDYATEPEYDDGWQGTTTDNTTGAESPPGDNGGEGFEPWNFDTDWMFPLIDGIHGIDDGLQAGDQSSSPFNDLGTESWRMALPTPVGTVGGLPRAGRGFEPLELGETIRVVIDNPTTRRFNGGYFVRFNSRNGEAGGGNICYEQEEGYDKTCSAADLNGDGHNVPLGATPEHKLTVSRYEYFDNGQWGVDDGDPSTPFYIPLFDNDTGIGGAQIDLTLTGENTYQLTIDPFGSAPSHTQSGILQTPGEPIDWLEFTFFNSERPTGDYNNDRKVDAADYVLWRKMNGTSFKLSNEAVTPGTVNQQDRTAWRMRYGNDATDLYIRSIEIFSAPESAGANVPEPGALVFLVPAVAGLFAARKPDICPNTRAGDMMEM